MFDLNFYRTHSSDITMYAIFTFNLTHWKSIDNPNVIYTDNGKFLFHLRLQLSSEQGKKPKQSCFIILIRRIVVSITHVTKEPFTHCQAADIGRCYSHLAYRELWGVDMK